MAHIQIPEFENERTKFQVKRTGKLTIVDIARMAGTTQSTVSRVLSNHPKISEATRKRVLKVVEQHGFRPNPYAQGIKGKETHFLAVLSRQINSAFFARILEGLNDGAVTKDYRLLCSFAATENDFLKVFNTLTHTPFVSGIVLIAPPLAFLQQSRPPAQVPVVFCSVKPGDETPAWSNTDSVTFDNKGTIKTIVEDLVRLGHKSILYIRGSTDNFDANERYQAFAREINRHAGLKVEVLQGSISGRDIQPDIEAWLERNKSWPDAVVCVNDSVAETVFAVMRKSATLDWTKHSLSGWDNSVPSQCFSISSVGLPLYEMGQAAFELAFNRISHASTPAKRKVLPSEWTPRSSTLSFQPKRKR